MPSPVFACSHLLVLRLELVLDADLSSLGLGVLDYHVQNNKGFGAENLFWQEQQRLQLLVLLDSRKAKPTDGQPRQGGKTLATSPWLMLLCCMQGGYCSADQAGTGCADQQWSDACCPTDGYNCLKFSASYWECRWGFNVSCDFQAW